MARWIAAAAVLAGAALAGAAADSTASDPADSATFRYQAPIVVQRAAPFVELAMPVPVYQRSRQAELRDLRIVDAAGQPVPYAWLPARAEAPPPLETTDELALYPLPARPNADGRWTAPVDVVVEGDRLTVRRHGAGRAGSTARRAGAAAARPGGWIVDLGDPALRPPGEPAPQRLRLAWSGPDDFSVAYDLAVSADLRSWRAAGSGQLLALRGGGAAALTQPDVPLPANGARFVRIVWADADAAPALTAARAVVQRSATPAGEAPLELLLAPSAAAVDPKDGAAAARAIDFDLGGTLPVSALELEWPSGTHVAPVRLQGRGQPDRPWRDLGAAVFYRLDRPGEAGRSAPLALPLRERYLRVIPDERSPALDRDAVRLRLRLAPAHLVYAAQGGAPWRLEVGSADSAPRALPIGTLVARLDDERARFGAATLGDFSEVVAAVKRDEREQRDAALRPWLLWAVLVFGVSGLAVMVWRLARAPRPPA